MHGDTVMYYVSTVAYNRLNAASIRIEAYYFIVNRMMYDAESACSRDSYSDSRPVPLPPLSPSLVTTANRVNRCFIQNG